MKNIINFSQMRKSILSSMGVLTALAIFVLPVMAGAETLTRQLQLGMSGSDVSSLQAFLAQDTTVYPQGLVTGYYGSLTASAVSKFQTKNGLASVGRVGPMTLSLINSRMGGTVAPMGVQWFNSVNVTPSTSGSTTANLSWNTAGNSSSVVYYSTSPIPMMEGPMVTIGGSSQLVSTSLNSSHSTTLSGLSPNTNYYYILYARDGAGNENITWPAMFHTN